MQCIFISSQFITSNSLINTVFWPIRDSSDQVHPGGRPRPKSLRHATAAADSVWLWISGHVA